MGTGECHCLKLMPASNARDQSAGLVTMPASMYRSPSRWSSRAKSPWTWRVTNSSGSQGRLAASPKTKCWSMSSS
ncbi:hypothetical protein D3C76_1331060 [compost metagenome]